jgi:hypothetical protein
VNTAIKKWRLTPHSAVTINTNLKLDTLHFSGDQFTLENSEDEFQRRVYNLENV